MNDWQETEAILLKFLEYLEEKEYEFIDGDLIDGFSRNLLIKELVIGSFIEKLFSK